MPQIYKSCTPSIVTSAEQIRIVIDGKERELPDVGQLYMLDANFFNGNNHGREIGMGDIEVTVDKDSRTFAHYIELVKTYMKNAEDVKSRIDSMAKSEDEKRQLTSMNEKNIASYRSALDLLGKAEKIVFIGHKKGTQRYN